MFYRSDIDGLRAVSILLILVYHVSNAALPGGFVGVDVFFVISGYLITRTIWVDFQTESFSFVDFYSRRVRRIFPAVLLVLVASLALGWSSLFAHEFLVLGKHVAASAGFVSNFVYQSEGGYFDLKSAEKPLLHLWSLAIEEQFYIVWPAVMLLAWRWSRSGGFSPSQRLLQVTGLACAGSLLFSAMLSWLRPDYVFYLLPARAWELCAGALLVALPTVEKKLWRDVLAWAGLLMVLVAAGTFNHDILYPGWAACIPVLGAMGLILSGPQSWVNQKLMSSSPLVSLGRWSFSIYLWHWPLLYFVRTLGWDLVFPWSPWPVIPVSVFLAVLTYYFVERPAKRLPLRASALGLLVSMVVVGFVGWNIYVRNGMDFRERMVIEHMGGVPAESSEGCLAQFSKYSPKFCRMHDDQRPADVLMLGDSIGHNAFTGMAQSYARSGKNLAMVGWPGVAPLLLTSSQLAVYEGDVGSRLSALLHDVAADNGGPQVVLAFRLPYELQPSIAGRLEPTLDFFSKDSGRSVIFVLEPPILPFAPILCVGMPPLRPKIQTACQLLVSELSAEYLGERERVIEILRSRRIEVFDAHQKMCSSGICNVTDNGQILYRNTRYLTETGSVKVFGEFLEEVRIP